MTHRKKWFFLLILIPFFLVGILGFLFVHYFLDPTLYRDIIQKSLSATLGEEVAIGRARINLWNGLGIVMEDFQVKDRSHKYNLFQSKKLILKMKLLPLLKREVKWKHLVVEQPNLSLYRDKKGQFNVLSSPLTGEGLKASQQKIIQIISNLFECPLTLRDGTFFLSDDAFGEKPLVTQIQDIHFHLSKIALPHSASFSLKGKIIHLKKEGEFSISGTIRDILPNMDLSKGEVEAKIELKGIETFHFWPYLKRFLPMETIKGTFNLKANYLGDFSGRFKTHAEIKFKELIFDYPRVFASVLRPKWVTIDLDANYDLKDLQVSRISVELPELSVKGRGEIKGIGTKGMELTAEAQSDLFDLSEGKKFIPYRIITPDVSIPLFRSEGSGPVQIVSVRLSGKLNEIEHCDQPLYAHTLSVEMKMDGAQIRLPWNLPPLNDLKGYLLFKGGDLNLKGVMGKILHSSTVRANGIFYRLLLIPNLQIHCDGRFDLSDFISLTKIEGIAPDIKNFLSPITSISGSAEYQLTAKGVLKPPFHFEHQGDYRLSKVRLTHQHIPFPLHMSEGKVALSNEGFQWEGAVIEFQGSSILMNGSWKKGEKINPLRITSKGKVELKSLFSIFQSSLFPEERRSQLSGFQEMSGDIEFNLKWFGKIEEWLTATREGEVRLKKISLHHRAIPIPLSNIEGSIFFSPDQIRIDEVIGNLGHSPLVISGTISQIASPSISTQHPKGEADPSAIGPRKRFSFKIYSSQLDLDALFSEGKEPIDLSLKEVKDWLLNYSFDGKMEIKQGRIGGFHYRNLKGELKTVDGKLHFRPFQFEGDGGNFWGEGWMKSTGKGVRFEIKPRFSNMEAKAFLRTVFRKGEEEKIALSGRVHIQKVELTGEGDNFQKIKESLNGRLKLEFENGVIERFNILAKIFSILNVFQLFKGRLPDLVTKGLPYHQITANIHVKDGVASTEDFIVDSDAIKITLIGKVDVGKNMIDAKLGVHPLVTVDTLLSHVPIAGYIFLGKDKAFLSYYYEVVGDLNDPRIDAIPIKSLNEAFLGIIKRLLESPLGSFQKTFLPEKERE